MTKTLETIDIKGKKYVTVNTRLTYFRSAPEFKGWRITEDLININEKEAVFKVYIHDDKGEIRVSAHAQEYRDNSYINKTSFLENGFTSALGRALGYLGIGIDTSICSAEELVNAITNQEKEKVKPVLNEKQFEAVMQGTKEQAINTMKKFRLKEDYIKLIKTKFNL